MNHSITHSMQMTIPDGVPVDAERTCIIQLDKHSNVDWLTTWVQFWEPKCHIFVLCETSHKKVYMGCFSERYTCQNHDAITSQSVEFFNTVKKHLVILCTSRLRFVWTRAACHLWRVHGKCALAVCKQLCGKESGVCMDLVQTFNLTVWQHIWYLDRWRSTISHFMQFCLIWQVCCCVVTFGVSFCIYRGWVGRSENVSFL